MRQGWYTSAGIITGVILTLLFSNFLVYAIEQRGGTVTILATVHPHRIVVVDENLTIISIVSNTAQDVRPLVVYESIDGPEIPYSDAIVEQYLALKPSLDFSKPGMIYEREVRPVPAFFQRTVRLIRSILPG